MATPDAVLAAEEQVRAAARLRGAAQALYVLARRSPADQQRASVFAMGLLARDAAPADWTAAGLPEPPPARQAAQVKLPVHNRAVVLLARVALDLHVAGLPTGEHQACWERLTLFFAACLPPSDHALFRLRERVLAARVDAGDTSPEVFSELAGALAFHHDVHGSHAYLTSVAQTRLATAFRLRRAENDLAASTAMAGEAVDVCAASYGPEHPLTLLARSLRNQAMLLQAESSGDDAERKRLGGLVLTEVAAIRAARGRLYGITAPNATVSLRQEADALLLLGQPERARQVLELALVCETAHNGTHQARTIADTLQLLARVHRDLGDAGRALEHAREASRIFCQHNPDGRGARQARALIEELTAENDPERVRALP